MQTKIEKLHEKYEDKCKQYDDLARQFDVLKDFVTCNIACPLPDASLTSSPGPARVATTQREMPFTVVRNHVAPTNKKKIPPYLYL